MTRYLCAAAVALVAALSAAADDKTADTTKVRVLIIDGQNNHDWKATTPHLKKVLEDCGRFTVEVATAPAKPKAPTKPKDEKDEAAQAKYKEELEKFKKDVEPPYKAAMAKFRPDLTKCDVVLSNYNGDLWSPEFQGDLEASLKAGKVALVIVHAANNSFPGWGEYNQMIGLGWRDNKAGDRIVTDDKGAIVRVEKGQGPGSSHGAKHAFKVAVRDAEHPITKGMPREWLHAPDELYHGLRGPAQNMQLLATAYSDKGKGGTGEHEPMIWTLSYGAGRVFHTPMGHDLDGMRCWGFIATLQRGTEWAATGKVTLPLPKEFPTADKVSQMPK
jgi:hypothetical protein